MMAINPATIAGYQAMQEYLDVENFADYMLLHFYADAEDWPGHNGHAAVNPVSGDGRYRFFVWDQEIVLDGHGRAASRIDNNDGAGALFQKLRTSEEFRLLFANRVYKHCFNGGALSLEGSTARYAEIAGWIDKAIVAESARWGDTRMNTPYGSSIGQPSPLNDINHYNYPPAPHGPDYYFTREDSWVVERDNVINNYIPAIHNTANNYAIINVLRNAGLYPGINPPQFSQHGGPIPRNFKLNITTTSGTIYYTLDGIDPRLTGGAISPTAIGGSSSASQTLLATTRVCARTLLNGTWSALHEAVFVLDEPLALRITEIHYHPEAPPTGSDFDEDDFEFLELQNVGETPIVLYGVQITGGVRFDFGSEDIFPLEPGQVVLLVEDLEGFKWRYDTTDMLIAGVYSGKLSNGGEELILLDARGETILDFTYDDAWYPTTDGAGKSLEITDAHTAAEDWGLRQSWKASTTNGGTPGANPLD